MAARTRTPLLLAAAGAAGLVATWVLAYRVGATERLDGAGFEDGQTWWWLHAGRIGDLVVAPMHAPLYVLLAGAVVTWAWRSRGRATGVAALAVLAVANVASQVVKAAVATERPWSQTGWGTMVDAVSWPSGHATASSALVVAAVLAAPAAWRRAVALVGGAWAVAVGVSVVGMGWHMPSDALAGWCVVTAVGGLCVAGLAAWDARPAARTKARAAAQSA